ncbi:MAG TPA: hypothetical protein DD725_03760 [Deltaproteobacteria bacterium]|nr:MAG: hypothetical protein A2Z89_03795 [Deltaproteobacteria bacterium GWA2_43_19]HBR16715.1 hypothetical protein [Deltaproteobacteria bacterium]
MKTLVDINKDTLNKAVALSGAKTKKEAIMLALEELIKLKLRQRLKDMSGSGGLEMSISDLKRMRRKREKSHKGLPAKNK